MTNQSYSQFSVIPNIIKGLLHLSYPAAMSLNPGASVVLGDHTGPGFAAGTVQPTIGYGANLLHGGTLGFAGTFDGNFKCPLDAYYHIKFASPIEVQTPDTGISAAGGVSIECFVTYPDGSSRVIDIDYQDYPATYVNDPVTAVVLHGKTQDKLRLNVMAFLPHNTVINFVANSGLPALQGCLFNPNGVGVHPLAFNTEITILGG